MLNIGNKTVKIFWVLFVLVSITIGFIITQNDPVEQARKEQDETMQVNAAEFIQATVLYYSIHSGLPWFSEEEKGENCYGNDGQIGTISMDRMERCIKVLIADSALREDFMQTSTLKSFTVTNPSLQTNARLDTVICFEPKSKFWQKDTNTRYNNNGTNALASSCYSQGGTKSCYWCTQ